MPIPDAPIRFKYRFARWFRGSHSPTLHDVVCAYKSLTSRKCKQAFGIEKIFQRSFVERIVRDREDYDIKRKNIRENTMKWYYEKLNNE